MRFRIFSLGFNFGFSIIIPPSDYRVMLLSCGHKYTFSCCILVQGSQKNNRSCVNGSKSCVNSYLQSLTPFFLADIITMEWATPKKSLLLEDLAAVAACGLRMLSTVVEGAPVRGRMWWVILEQNHIDKVDCSFYRLMAMLLLQAKVTHHISQLR